jgi:IS1 family transposase
MTWIEQFAKDHAQKPEPEGRAPRQPLAAVPWDRMIGAADHGRRARRDVARSEKKSQQLWIWKAWDRASGRLVDGECGGRDRATLERLLARVRRWNPRLYCTDDWAAYEEAIPQGRLYVGKDQTHGLERDHARQRHWLARFRRRSIVVSKAKRPAAAPPPRRGIGPQARWSTPRSPCSPASPATTGSASSRLC